MESEDGFVRGYGWVYHRTTTGLTKTQIAQTVGAEETTEVVTARKVVVKEKATYIIASGGGPSQTKIWIFKIVGGEISRRVVQELGPAIDATAVISNIAGHIQRYGSDALGVYSRWQSEATNAAFGGVDTLETYQQLDVENKQKFGTTLADGVSDGWLHAHQVETIVEGVDDGNLTTDQVIRAKQRIESVEHPSELREVTKAAPVAAIQLIADAEFSTLEELLRYEGKGDTQMVQRLAELYKTDFLSADQINTFGHDLEALREADVDGVEHVINEDIVVNGEAGNVQGALYEFRVANARVDDLTEIREIGKEIETVEYEALSDSQIEQLIKEIHFPNANSPEEKRDVIKNALSPDDQGRPKTMELDLIMENGDYIEAKSKDDISWTDIRDKVIRYKANQLDGRIDPADGEMKVVGRPGRFTDSRTRSGDPNDVGRLIKETRGLTKETLEK